MTTRPLSRMGTITIANYLLLGTLNHPLIFGGLAVLATYAIGLSQSRPRIHSLLALVPLLVFVVLALTVLAQPDFLSQIAP